MQSNCLTNNSSHVALSPISISNCLIKSRLGFGPVNSGLFDDAGGTGRKCLEFYEQYFSNDLGLVYIGGVAVSPEGRSSRRSLLLDTGSKCEGLRRVTDIAHRYGTRVVVQLMHAGRQASPDELGVPTVACSPIPCPIVQRIPVELDRQGIRRIIKDFGISAALAEQAGADLVEIHASHGYLISGFLSPFSNSRTDEFGGSLSNRFRFLAEILSEVRTRIAIPVGVRINCTDNVPNGIELDDVIIGIKEIIGGLIDYIGVSGGVYSTDDIIMPPRNLRALWKAEATRLKAAVTIPVFLTGNIDSLASANQLITERAADVILMVRSLLADPLLVPKSLAGREHEVQQCIDCKLCKYHTLGLDSIYCPFNPVLNKLHRHEITEVVRAKNLRWIV